MNYFYLSVIFFTALDSLLFVSAQEKYELNNKEGQLTFTYFKEKPYVTKVPEEKCFIMKYIDEAIFQLLQYVNFKKDPPYSDDVYDLMRSAIAGNTTIKDLWKSKEYQETLKDSQLGFAICVGVGLILALVVPLVGLIIFICKCCCNKCRAKYELPKIDQDEPSTTCENCSRKFLTLWLVVFVFVLFFCGCMLLWVNFDLGNSTDTWGSTLDSGKQDLETYSKNVQKGYQYAITEQVLSLKDVLYTKNLNNTQKTLGRLIQNKIIKMNPKFEEANGTLYALESEIRKLLRLYSGIDLKSSSAVRLQKVLETDLKDLVAEINKTLENCGSACEDAPIVDYTKPPKDNFEANFSRLDNFLTLQADILDLVVSSKEQFEKVMTDTEGQTLDTRKEVLDTLEQAKNSEYSYCYEKIVENVKNITQLIPGESEDYEEALSEDIYRSYAGYGVAGFVLLLSFLFTISMCCGICGYDEEATPAQRTSYSHCGALTLITSAALCFISFALLMLLSISGVLSGGNFKLMICQDMSYSFLKKVIDVPDTVPGYKGNFAATVLYNEPENDQVKLGTVIKRCGASDESATVGLMYDNYVENLLQCLEKMNLKGKLHTPISQMNVDIKTDHLLPTTEKIDNITTSYSDVLDEAQKEAQQFSDTLEKGSIEAFTLSTQSYELRLFADRLISPDSSVEDDKRVQLMRAQLELQQASKKMENINEQYLNPLKDKKAQILEHLKMLLAKIESIKRGSKVEAADGKEYILSKSAVKTLMDEAAKTLKDTSEATATPWSLATKDYQNRLYKYVNEHERYVETEIDKRIGHCKPLYNIHRAMYESSCNHVLADYNQFWFFLLIATLCFIPLIFFGMKLSNYYRILEPEDSESFDKRFQAEGVPLKTVDPVFVEEFEEQNHQSNNSSSHAVNPRMSSSEPPRDMSLNLNNPKPPQRFSQSSQPASPVSNMSGSEIAEYPPSLPSRSSSGYQAVRTTSESPVKHGTNIC